MVWLSNVTFNFLLTCLRCQEVIEVVGELFPTLIMMNTIPVIFHKENKKDAEKEMLNAKDLNAKYIPFCKTTKELQKELGIGNASVGCHLKAMVACNMINLVVGEKKRKFTVPLKVENPMSQFGVVIIEKGIIKKKIIYSTLEKRIDFGLFINDIGSKPGCKESITKLKNSFPKVQAKIQRKNTLTINRKEEWTLIDDILSDDIGRYYFKAHAINEQSVENILFIEQVNQLKSIYLKKGYSYGEQFLKLKEIYKTFLDPKDAIMLVNVPEKLSNLLHKELKSFDNLCVDEMNEFIESVSELMNDLLKVVKSTLCDTYSRFKTGRYYQDYQKGSSIEMMTYLV
jgi:hypothetical protein